MTTRRAFLGALAGALAGPVAARAQSTPKARRIGWLGGPTREAAQPYVQPFLQGLTELGWIEGQNIVIEWRFGGGRAERLPALAAELVRLGVELIVVPSTPTALAASNATKTIPLITVGGNDPVELGLVPSLARPGGNITGLTVATSPEITGKQMELLKETVPRAARIAVLWNPATKGNAAFLREAETAARRLAVELQVLEARGSEDFDAAFRAMAAKRADALALLGDVMFVTHAARLAELATKARRPAMYTLRPFVEAGGLIAYGPRVTDNFRRAASYVDRILKGAKPGDLPIERPTTFELVVNLKAAKAIGLTIPPALLQRADEVIQ
ncbi:MAG TPA: ABC transporter substrate-binding protein [Methylomirabilota bacterium]|nr:ABC transporter substrate-binding protein [Methylomirabilota bacterium]